MSVADHGVQDGEKFSGDGYEGELDGFSGVDEALAEGLELRVASGRDEGGEVERTAYVGAAGPDMPLAAPLSAVAGVRSEAGDGPAVELAGLGQQGDDDAGQAWSEAGRS